MYRLELDYHFSSAHQLTNAYDDKCNASIHGHNWKVKIIIETKKLKNSMVIDFTKLKEIVDELDHRNLNQILDFEPTAENISKYLYERIKKEIKGNVIIELQESEGAKIIYFK